jgi:large subunit ribosomal protein L24e
MAKQPSQGSLLDLKAITDEHVNRFAAEGRAPVKGAKRNVRLTTNQFDKPSPGLVKRLAHEARNEDKRSFVGDELSKSTRANLEAKAIKYEAMSRGDFSGLTERELAEVVVDVSLRIRVAI